jgi:hypothetical protein
LNRTKDCFFVEEYLWRRRRDDDDYIVVKHGTLMEYEKRIIGFLEKLCFHNQNVLF